MADGAAMRIEERGHFFAGSVFDGFVEVTGDGAAIFAFEVDVFGLGQTQLRNQLVVCFGEASEIVSSREIDFVGAIEHADLRGDRAIFAE